MRTRLLVAAALLCLAAAGGCRTAIGNYFGNRARDFGECFRVHAGVGVGLAVDAKAAGLLHGGLGLGLAYPDKQLGWRYGQPVWPGSAPAVAHRPMWGNVHTPLTHHLGGRSFTPDSVLHLGEASAAPTKGGGVHGCWWLLPALFSTRDGVWLWSEPWIDDRRAARWARIHAFDVELGVTAGVLHAQAGFSPGEFLDFLLGWFGLDLAGDDR